MTTDEIKKHIIDTVLHRLDRDNSSRHEALEEFMTVVLPTVDERAAKQVSGLVPTLPDTIYEKWATMFAERLLETVERRQLELLCDGSEDNNATVCLVYLMFMESERMEKQIAEDLHALGVQEAATDAVGNVLGAYFKNKLDQRKEDTTLH
ncbi:hypothetical protein [Oleidesulfovibrio sp.]|uniref:hypothetical protein n=1 Tax=Oleidesulfovibrio sp. TaxID=2909707 RepID=UPI003A8489F4